LLGLLALSPAAAGSLPLEAESLVRRIDAWQARVFKDRPDGRNAAVPPAATGGVGDARWRRLRADALAAVERSRQRVPVTGLCSDRKCGLDLEQREIHVRAAHLLANDLARRLAHAPAVPNRDALWVIPGECVRGGPGGDPWAARAGAFACVLALDFDGADAFYRDALKRTPADPEIQIDYGIFLHRAGRLAAASGALTQAAERGRAERHEVRTATALQHLANVLADLEELPRTRTTYAEALELRRGLAVVGGNAALLDLATTLNNYGTILMDRGEKGAAEAVLREALAMRLDLAAVDAENYLSNVAVTLNNLSELFVSQGRSDASTEAREHAVAAYRLLADGSFALHGPDLGGTLVSLAGLRGAAGDLVRTEDALRQSADVFRNLVRADRQFHQALAHVLLAQGDVLLGRHQAAAAEVAIEEAISIYRMLLARQKIGIDDKAAAALLRLGWTRIAQKHYREAATAWAEAATLASGRLLAEARAALGGLMRRLDRLPGI
jgi:tetratricopeptide (TPR) repeat protein